MTKLTMPEPVAYVRFADNGNIRMWSKSAYEGEEFMKPLYTAEALRDVLEQAAKRCDELDNDENSIDYRNGAAYSAIRIRAMTGEIK